MIEGISIKSGEGSWVRGKEVERSESNLRLRRIFEVSCVLQVLVLSLRKVGLLDEVIQLQHVRVLIHAYTPQFDMVVYFLSTFFSRLAITSTLYDYILQ
jgi:hypothetical protein